MFDLSVGKLLIVAAVALIVIGPERLPAVARTAGLLINRLQRYILSVKNELRQEMEKAEFAQLEHTFRSAHDEISHIAQASFDNVSTTLPPSTPRSNEKIRTRRRKMPSPTAIATERTTTTSTRAKKAPDGNEINDNFATHPLPTHQLPLFDELASAQVMLPSQHRDRR